MENIETIEEFTGASRRINKLAVESTASEVPT